MAARSPLVGRVTGQSEPSRAGVTIKGYERARLGLLRVLAMTMPVVTRFTVMARGRYASARGIQGIRAISIPSSASASACSGVVSP